MKNIYIVDRFVEKHLHVLANVNLIKIISELYPDNQKLFIAEEEHSKLVSSYFEAENQLVKFKSYQNKKYSETKLDSLKRVINRTVKDIHFFKQLFKKVKKNNYNDVVFITHIYPVSLLIFVVQKLFHPKTKIILTIHGEVEYIFFSKNIYQKFIGLLYKLSFKIKNKNLIYLFLTKVSRDILVKNKILRNNEFATIILPTITNYKVINKENKYLSKPVKIGHVGSSGLRKNIDQYYEFAKRFESEIKNNIVEFSIIGTLEDDIKEYINLYVKDYVQGKTSLPLARELFNEEVKKLDYSIFFYGKNDFILRSSGAFFDTINYEIPIIALKNPFFENIFEEAGEIGYLCEDLNELESKIKDICKKSNNYISDYSKFTNNIKYYKTTLYTEEVANDIKSQISTYNIKI